MRAEEDEMDSVPTKEHQLDLAVPLTVLERGLQLPVGEELNMTASTDMGTQLKILLRKELPAAIRMVFTGLADPADGILKCCIDSVDCGEGGNELSEGSYKPDSKIFCLRSDKEKKKSVRCEPISGKRRETWKQKRANRGKKSTVSAHRAKKRTMTTRLSTEQEVQEEHSENEKHPRPTCENDTIKVSNTQVLCQVCGHVFPLASDLSRHLVDHKLSVKEYEELLLEGKIREFAKRAQVKYSETQPEGDFVCNVCGQTFNKQFALAEHLSVHRVVPPPPKDMVQKGCVSGRAINPVEPISLKSLKRKTEEENNVEYLEQCQICNVKFRTKMSLWNHIRKHNIDSYKYQSLIDAGILHEYLAHQQQDGSADSEMSSKSKKARLKCPFCEKCCLIFNELEEHVRRHHSECGKDVNIAKAMEDIQKKHSKVDNIVTLNCPSCGTKVAGAEILQHLKEQHFSEPGYEALRKECSASLDGETKKARMGNFPQQCPLCWKEVRQRFLRSHILKFCAKNPDRISLLKCRRCGYHTVDSNKMKEHEKKHDPAQVFMCHMCGKSYRHSSGLTRHERCTHKIFKRLPLKPFICQQCGKSFLLKHQFQLHLVTHTDDANMMCHICGKMFKRHKAVKHHIKTQHLNIFPYQCQKCGHGMERRSTYESHKCDGSKPKNAKKLNKMNSVTAPVLSQAEVLKAPESESLVTGVFAANPQSGFSFESSYFYPRSDMLQGRTNVSAPSAEEELGPGTVPALFSSSQATLMQGQIDHI